MDAADAREPTPNMTTQQDIETTIERRFARAPVERGTGPAAGREQRCFEACTRRGESA